MGFEVGSNRAIFRDVLHLSKVAESFMPVFRVESKSIKRPSLKEECDWQHLAVEQGM